jgi:NADH-quinone oxidoreductase subunit B
VMIVAGRVVMKMLPVLQRIWMQMHEPKWCISMGACASTGGVFDTYCVVQGIDRFLPVDMYVPGCPPRPEQLMEGIVRLHEAVRAGVPPAYELRSVAS